MIIKVKCYFPVGDLLMATRNLQEDGGNWENRIISISALSRNIGEDKSYEISGMTIEMNDSDRFFRDMMSGDNRYISGKKVEILKQDGSLIYTGSVEKWQFREDGFTLDINDRLSGLEVLIPGIIDKETYPDMAEKANGEAVPLIYGTIYGDAGAVKCWRVGTGSFLLAGHHCKELTGDVYLEDGTAVSGATLDNAANGRAYISCSRTEDFIYANVKGKADAQGDLIEDPIDAMTDIITNHTSMSYNSGEMDRARAIMAERGYKIAAVIDGQKNLHDVLKEFSFSFDCDFYIGKGSEIIISMLNWSALEPESSFEANRIIGFELNVLPENIRNKVKYRYKYNQALGEYGQTPVYAREDSVANWGEFYNRNEPLELKYVYDDVAAFDVVQRYVIQRQNPGRIANLEVPLSEFSGVDIAGVIEVQHPGAVDINPRKYQVRRVNIDFTADVVQLEAVDITALTGGVFILGDTTQLQPQWQLAGDNDRDFGYLADSVTGYFANNVDYGKVLY